MKAGQKGFYTRLKSELQAVIRNRANFVIRRVGPKSADKLRDQGFLVKNGRAIIRTDFDGKFSVKNGVIKIEGPHETKHVWNHSIEDLLSRDEIYDAPFDVRMKEAKFRPGIDYWCFSIGGKPIGPLFDSYMELIEWLESPENSSNVQEKLTTEGKFGQAYLMHYEVKRGVGAEVDFQEKKTRKAARRAANKSWKGGFRK